VPDNLVQDWVLGLPGPRTAVVSLLGRKHGAEGISEYSFYSFSGGNETNHERRNRTSFQDWLNQHHGDLDIVVRERPTNDFIPIPLETLVSVAADLK